MMRPPIAGDRLRDRTARLARPLIRDRRTQGSAVRADAFGRRLEHAHPSSRWLANRIVESFCWS
jgi:hypothetical protein